MRPFPKLWQSHKPLEVALKGLSKKAGERLIHHALGPAGGVGPRGARVEQSGGNAGWKSGSQRRRRPKRRAAGDRPGDAAGPHHRLDAGPRRAVLAASVYRQPSGLAGWRRCSDSMRLRAK